MSGQSDSEKLLRVQVLSLDSSGLELEQVERLQVRLKDGSWLGIRPGACCHDCGYQRWRAQVPEG